MRTREQRGWRAHGALGALGVLGALGLAACWPELETRSGAPVDAIELATWNVAWLGAEDGKGTIARREADYARLRAYAARLDADIVALQEVAGEAAAGRVLDPAIYAFAMSEEREAQRTGFAYKKSLAITRHPDVIELDVGGVRRGVDITVHLGKERLRLLGVHLKSGCFGGALDRDAPACVKLRKQLPALEAWIDAREREGVPFAVLGDFNRRLRRGEGFWTELDDRDPEPAPLTLVTDGRRSRCWNGKYPDFIDHIVLDAQAAAWLVPHSFEQLLYDDADARYRETLSDHCPISVKLGLAGARQPGAGAGPAAAGSAAGADAGSEAPDAGAGVAGRADRDAPGAGADPASATDPIKGNIARGRKLYHLPSCPSYDEVRIDADQGERLFASEREAQAAGFRKAGNCP